MKCDTLIIDGRHALWRNCDVFKELSVELDGKYISTGGIYGVLNMMIRIRQRYGGRVIVAWEGDNNFRKEIYPKYKDRGRIMPEQIEAIQDMREQEKRLQCILRLIGIRQYYGIGCEADDVIGRLSEQESKADRFVIIYSGDSDLRQLVNYKIYVASPGYRGSSDIMYDPAEVEKKHGVRPKQIVHLKALAGDTSDNIPGVPGVGEKTAVKLIREFGTISEVIDAANDDNSNWPVYDRFRKIILDEFDNLWIYLRLTKIRVDAEMEEIKPIRDKKKLIQHFMAYRFRSLLIPSEMYKLLRMA